MITYLETGKPVVLENSQIVRGPYLQLGSESSIAIRWATDTPVQGRVLCRTKQRSPVTI
jgi:acid phosphatase type 7